MKRPVKGSLLLASPFLMACGGAQAATNAASIAEQAEIAAYGAEEQECVAKAQTRSDADVCIMQVQARWCGDGGALSARGDCPAQRANRLLNEPSVARGVLNAILDGGSDG